VFLDNIPITSEKIGYRRDAMFAKMLKPVDVRLVVFVLTLVLFLLGAGAPGATGI
jgi:hypothetical protein